MRSCWLTLKMGHLVTTVLKGKVVDTNHNPVRGAAVIISKSPVGIREIAVLTDQKGDFVLFDLLPGSYELIANTMEGAMGELTLNIVDDDVRFVNIVTQLQAQDDR